MAVDATNLEALLNLVVLYWQATNPGTSFPVAFLKHAGARTHELLRIDPQYAEPAFYLLSQNADDDAKPLAQGLLDSQDSDATARRRYVSSVIRASSAIRAGLQRSPPGAAK